MAAPTQFACEHQPCPDFRDEDHSSIHSLPILIQIRRNTDRTLKGIGVVDASPVYEPLAGFQR